MGRTLMGRINGEISKVETGIRGFSKRAKKFEKKVAKSPLTRFGKNLSNSINREVFG